MCLVFLHPPKVMAVGPFCNLKVSLIGSLLSLLNSFLWFLVSSWEAEVVEGMWCLRLQCNWSRNGLAIRQGGGKGGVSLLVNSGKNLGES